MNQLITYLRDNLILDFQGDLSLEDVRTYLKDDDSREARALLSKLVEGGGVDDLMLVLADCLAEEVKKQLTDDTMRNQLRSYAES